MRKTIIALTAALAVLAPTTALAAPQAVVREECEGPRMRVVNGVCKYVPPTPRKCDEEAIRRVLWFFFGCSDEPR